MSTPYVNALGRGRTMQEVLNSFSDTTEVQFFNNSKYVGIEIQVSRQGWGFGAITISHNLEDGTWHLDDESTKKERVCKFLIDAAPKIVEALHGKGDVKFVPKDDGEWVSE